MIKNWERLKEDAELLRRLLEVNWDELPEVESWDQWMTAGWRSVGEFIIRRSLARGDLWWRRNSGGHDGRLHFKGEELVQLVTTRDEHRLATTVTPTEVKRWIYRFGRLPEVHLLPAFYAERAVVVSGVEFLLHECRTRLALPLV